MSKCRTCNIEILDETEYCPLCRTVLEQNGELENMYPDARLKTQRLLFVSRLYLFCAIVLEFVFVLLDFSNTDAQVRWSVITGLAFLYIYTVIRYAILGKSGYRSKTIVLILLAVLLAVGIDFATGYRGWAVDYVMSGGILLMDAVIILLMFCNRRGWQSYIMWQIFMILCSLVPLILYLTGIEKNRNMAVLPIVISAFLFLGTLMLGGRRAWLELRRRFHIS